MRPNELASKLNELENGELTSEQIVEVFQHLIDTGLAWELQGWYGRTAAALIKGGHCHAPE